MILVKQLYTVVERSRLSIGDNEVPEEASVYVRPALIIFRYIDVRQVLCKSISI